MMKRRVVEIIEDGMSLAAECTERNFLVAARDCHLVMTACESQSHSLFLQIDPGNLRFYHF